MNENLQEALEDLANAAQSVSAATEDFEYLMHLSGGMASAIESVEQARRNEQKAFERLIIAASSRVTSEEN